MNKTNNFREQRIRESLESKDQYTLNQRVRRKLEIDHQGIIGSHHFAKASSECINLYQDGYFIAAVMMSHAINEAIVRFIAEKNAIAIDNEKEKCWHSKLMVIFGDKKILTIQSINASKRIWKSYRNDIHHMNPTVSRINFPELAKNNLQYLSVVEKEIFGATSKNGALIPTQPKYWNSIKRGTVSAHLRLD